MRRILATAVVSLAASLTLTACSSSDDSTAGGEGSDNSNAGDCTQTWTCESWRDHSTLNTPRSATSALRLSDGRILVAGGAFADDQERAPLRSTEIFDPTSGVWSVGPEMSIARVRPLLLELADGDVLIFGGPDYPGTAVDRFDASDETISAVAPRQLATNQPAVALLDDGRVLTVGGTDPQDRRAGSTEVEIYDPAANTWSTAASVPEFLAFPTLDPLEGGRVLFVGHRHTGDVDGICDDFEAVGYTYDATSDAWAKVQTGCVAEHHMSVRLPDGRIAFVGGLTCDMGGGCASVFDPGTDTWQEIGNTRWREDADVVALPDGRVLIQEGTSYYLVDTDQPEQTYVRMPGEYQGHSAMIRTTGCEILKIGGDDNTYRRESLDIVRACGQP